MIEPAIPLDESRRLTSLRSLRVLDTAPDERFDRITRLVARSFNVDICLFSLVDSQRQWFKSKQGISISELPRSLSFCGHAILDDEVFHVEDARHDARFTDNPLVTSGPKVRFYAGFPIRCPMGHRVGTFCIMDRKPRDLSPDEQETLRDLSELVEDELALVLQSTIDDLTQVFNRRGFKNVARHLLPLCRRTGAPANIAFFDLDNFTKINADHGYEAGNRMLQKFAVLLCRSFGSADVIARLDADMFAVFYAGSDASSDVPLRRLEALAESERDAIEGELTWSVGRVALDPDRHSTIDCFLEDAGTKMCENKLRKTMA